MRFHPSLTTLCIAVALTAGGLGTHAMASEHDESSSDESQDSAQEGSQALDDDALQEKYGITPGALKRDEPASEDESGGGGQASEQDTAQEAEQDTAQEAEQDAEQDPTEEQEGDSGDVVTDVTEVESGDEGVDETEEGMPTN
ncbi:hypothetical protein KG088_15575 [Halomonas sp. TRM85114]|uniref:hypothetical protein n=1 Tax=Halomonas jincaotanensis TaxID=2810616 RepID=UPI001BD1EE50|nr:hypothetical protein [Halomonas jincaotanensis]MBS9405044.1 hypothetical protein [Halomonas jincaotanensis]